ncbi:epoxide hydrolase family protein [Sphingomonas natans]|uniref:epoxide hydrolase family protein n=1 Tax=Sphingomonas natans TaxID=3063330 RepID=UPI003133BCA6
MSEAITPFHLCVEQAALDDLQRRLSQIRWPERETVEDWRQGVPLDQMQRLCEHWRSRHDWRRCEAMLNGFGQFRTRIDGLDLHFLHIRSPEANVLPVIMTHGWPGSVIECHKVIGPLTDPAAYGGDRADAFDLVIPSLPGYGFSDRPDRPGWTIERIAQAWAVLMRRLGYDRFCAQGGDWGASVTTEMAVQQAPGLAGIHLNLILAPPPTAEELSADPQSEQRAQLDRARYHPTAAAMRRSSAPGPRRSATGCRIHRSGRQRGSTRNSSNGPTVGAIPAPC